MELPLCVAVKRGWQRWSGRSQNRSAPGVAVRKGKAYRHAPKTKRTCLIVIIRSPNRTCSSKMSHRIPIAGIMASSRFRSVCPALERSTEQRSGSERSVFIVIASKGIGVVSSVSCSESGFHIDYQGRGDRCRIRCSPARSTTPRTLDDHHDDGTRARGRGRNLGG